MKHEYQPKTGSACGCRRGQQRDNCPRCEGTGMVIDFGAIRARNTVPRCMGCGAPTTLDRGIPLLCRSCAETNGADSEDGGSEPRTVKDWAAW